MTTTTIRRLTAMNVRALREIGVAETLGATYAVFNGTPGQAVGAIRRAETADTRRSLNAVVRKLLDGAHVTLDEPAAAPAAAVAQPAEITLDEPVAGMLPLAGGEGFLF